MLRSLILFILFAQITFIYSQAEAQPGAHWTGELVTIYTPDCRSVPTTIGQLVNDGSKDVIIDSVRILDDMDQVFSIISSDPPNRLGGFILQSSSDTISYTIRLSPGSSANDWHFAKLVFFSKSGDDTLLLEGFRSTSRLRFVDPIQLVGPIPVGERYEIAPVLINLGTKDFTFTRIETDSLLHPELRDLGVGVTLHADNTWQFPMTILGDTTGEITETIVFYGDECDTPVVLTIKATFEPQRDVAASLQPSIFTISGNSLVADPSARSAMRYAVHDILGHSELAGSLLPGERLDLSHLSPGIYIITGANKSGTRSMKFAR